MIKESTPNSLLAYEFPPGRPPLSREDGDSWASLANAVGLDPWQLIEFNFPFIASVTPFDEKCCQVNWLMRTHLGCAVSNDGTNYSFDSSDLPGCIYLPNDGTLGYFDTGPGLEARRRLVFAKAMEFFKEGAHFVLGSRAQILERHHFRGSRAAVWLEEPITNLPAPSVLTAGSQDEDGDRQVCVGRFRHPDVRAAGGREIKASDPDLRTYLAELRLHQTLKTPHAAWPPFKRGAVNLTPRTFFEAGRNVIVLERTVSASATSTVSALSTPAARRPHGGGRTPFTYAIWQYRKGKAGPVVMNRDDGPSVGWKAKTGDVVIKNDHHIGICGVDRKNRRDHRHRGDRSGQSRRQDQVPQYAGARQRQMEVPRAADGVTLASHYRRRLGTLSSRLWSSKRALRSLRPA